MHWLKHIALTAACLIAVNSSAQSANTGKPISIGETRELKSQVLSETRVLNIYLPEGYSSTDTTRYQVIYLLDGGLDEDFIHVSGLVQFATFPWVNYLPASIVVGISNIDRKKNLSYPTTIKADKEKFPSTGGSAKFMAFIEKELQPYIKQQFKTSGQRMLIGQSLGGLFAAEVLVKKPALFDEYMIISPSLWWDDGSLLNTEMVKPLKPINVYLAVGKEGLGLSEKPHVMEVDVNLFAEKITLLNDKNISLYFDYLPEENHGTILHQALLNAFRRRAKK